jgi:squalene synthase HpnC
VVPEQCSADGRSPGADWPAPAQVLARAGGENFPVASRLLPRAERAQLLAIYGFARLTDDLGDEWAGDRMAALAWLDRELDAAMAGGPAHPVVTAAARTVRDVGVGDEPLRHLIEANRRDQLVHRYASFDDLVGYCTLSANPVGLLVLAVFRAATPERQRWSDAICTGLQLVEHWQDVAEDAAAGRVYLPLDDLDRFGVEDARLGDPASSPELRALMAFEVARARAWLGDGRPLVGALGGRHGWAVAGFVAGGEAALDAIAGADFDVLAAPRKPSPVRFACRLGALVAAPGRW